MSESRQANDLAEKNHGWLRAVALGAVAIIGITSYGVEARAETGSSAPDATSATAEGGPIVLKEPSEEKNVLRQWLDNLLDRGPDAPAKATETASPTVAPTPELSFTPTAVPSPGGAIVIKAPEPPQEGFIARIKAVFDRSGDDDRSEKAETVAPSISPAAPEPEAQTPEPERAEEMTPEEAQRRKEQAEAEAKAKAEAEAKAKAEEEAKKVTFNNEATGDNDTGRVTTVGNHKIPKKIWNHLYITQYDPEVAGLFYNPKGITGRTIGKSGCGPASTAMIEHALTGKTAGIMGVAEWMIRTGFRTKGGTASKGIELYLEEKGLKVERVSIKNNEEAKNAKGILSEALKDPNKRVIMWGQDNDPKTPASPGGHIYPVVGINPETEEVMTLDSLDPEIAARLQNLDTIIQGALNNTDGEQVALVVSRQ